MSLIQEILDHEVFPAVGCTEPISCAFACAAAAAELPRPAERIELTVDPATYKNGAAVTIPHSGGRTGNPIAAAMGALIARPELHLEILRDVTPEVLSHAVEMLASGRVTYRCDARRRELYVEAIVTSGASRVRCVVSGGHTHVACLQLNGGPLPTAAAAATNLAYRERLKALSLEEVLGEALRLTPQQRAYIQRGIDMNLAIAEKGIDLHGNAFQLHQMMKQGLMADDLFFRVKTRVASALDARMGGLPEPVMTSGGSGNQGTMTILLPYLVGRDRGIDLPRIQESIAIGHAVNSYIKQFTGELSAVCGCAIAASIAASVAIVYQHVGIDMAKITLAVHNILGDLCGIICDGAKPGCSLKIVSGTDAAMRSAFMALAGHGASPADGVIGQSAEESIRNLSRISLEGMGGVDATVVNILQHKAAAKEA
jgi:L-cysteine desulfidase